MEPFERFKKLNTEGNLWIYILLLGREREICYGDLPRLIFEKFGFLPGKIISSRVLYRLKNQGYIKSEKYKGRTAYRTAEKGIKELEKMKGFYKELLRKI